MLVFEQTLHILNSRRFILNEENRDRDTKVDYLIQI